MFFNAKLVALRYLYYSKLLCSPLRFWKKIHNKVPVVMSSVKLCYTFFPISSLNEYTDANVTFH